MLETTFCHLPGVGPVKEKQLQRQGIRTWNDALATLDPDDRKHQTLLAGVLESKTRLAKGDCRYFTRLLPSKEQVRMFRAFRSRAVFLDIETTGLSPWDTITTIATYDGKTIQHYVQGKNLDQFARDLDPDGLLVTFNGKTFDLPFIRKQMNLPMDQAHIDLRYVMAGLGYKGGLKKCEKALGLDRGELDGVDGSFAVLLWEEYQRAGHSGALDTLLAYNIEDVLNLEILMVTAYNRRMEALGQEAFLEVPVPPPNPFVPDMRLVDRLRPAAFRPW